MKKERDQALHGKSLALGKLHKSIVGTNVEGKIFIFLGIILNIHLKLTKKGRL